MESGKDLPGNDSGGGGGRSSSEREFDCKGCGAKNVVKKSEGTPTTTTTSRDDTHMTSASFLDFLTPSPLCPYFMYRAGRPIIRKVSKIRIWGVPPVCLGSR